MTIAPIDRAVTIKAPPARAFALFTERMGEWWAHGQTLGAKPHETIVIEPRVGGSWFERDADGVETAWGEVIDWDPPRRVRLAWRLGSDWAFHADRPPSEVEVTFEPAEGGGTHVRLIHDRLENLATPEATRAQLDGGWPTHLTAFANFADKEPTA